MCVCVCVCECSSSGLIVLTAVVWRVVQYCTIEQQHCTIELQHCTIEQLSSSMPRGEEGGEDGERAARTSTSRTKALERSVCAAL